MEVDVSSESGSEGDFLDSDALEVPNDHHMLQKVNKLEEYLPFTEEIRQNRQAFLLNLKNNALKAVLEQGESLNNWMFAFDHYLTAFGYAFTKDEHIIFVKICLQALDSIADNIPVSLNLLKLTTRLLAKTYLLSRKDIIIDWRLIYRLFERTVYSPHNTAKTLSCGYRFEDQLRKLLNNARVYFSVESTAEIFSEWRQYLCIYSSKFSRAASVLANFLPTLLYPEEHQYGYQLWFQEFMELWISLPENGKNITSHNCFVKLFSRLAKDAKGFIDWDPYLPVVFERFKGLFRVDTYSYGNDEVIKLYIQWIVYSIFDASKALDNLQQFFRLRSVHFFISKEKSNSQFQKVVDVAVKALTNRLRSERYKRNWFNFALPASNLNNRLVNEFAKIMMTTVEKIGFKDFDLENLYNLCNISAPILSGQVIEKLDLAYEQICEPKRLTTALQMFSMSLLPILTNEMTAAQYRLNVLPILTSLASNINTYDENLAFLQLLSIRSILVLGLPLVDCSHLAETADGSVDDSAKQLLLDTRQLDEFAHEFLRCCFTIIESNNEDLLKMSKSHFSVKTLLHESLLYVLANSSPATTKVILDKLFNYANSHIIENKKAAEVLGQLLQAAFTVNAQYSMERFFSVVVENTLATIGNKTKIADICKTELAYNLKLLKICYLVNDGKVLLAQEAKIVQVLEAIMNIQFEDTFGSMKNWNLLGSLFTSLLEVGLISRVLPISKDDVQQLTNWPKTYALKDMPFEWHVPKENELAFAQRLFKKFIEPEISRLDKWADSKLELSKEQLEQSLDIVSDFASLKCFPSFSGGDDCSPYLQNDICATNLFPGSSIRDDLMTLMGRVLKRLLTTTDTSSLLTLVQYTVSSLAIPYNYMPSFLSSMTRSFDFRKLCQPLNNDTFFIPTVQYARMKDYHKKLTNSVKALREMKYTSGHKAAVEQLFILATCPYESVRKSANWPLMKLLRIFPQSVELIVPDMLFHLQDSDQKNSFEGSLSVLIGSIVDSMLIHPPHSSVYQLWPQLLKTNFEAVPKLAETIDYEKFSLISMIYITIPIKRNLMKNDFLSLFEKAKQANFLLSSEEMKVIELVINQWNEKSQNLYNDLIQQICVTLKEHKLQFRMQTLGTFLLNLLIRPDQLPPENMISYFLDALIHDSIHVRRTAVMGLKKILFLNRAPKETVQVQYKAGDFQMDVYASEEVYNSTQFHDKAHAGYFEGAYTARKISKVPVSTNGFIAEKFKDKQYLDRLFELFSVENATAIDFEFVKIWKYLYQSFELINDELVFPHIEKLLEVDKHSHDKLAIEVLIGLANALPVLNYVDAFKVVQFISTICKKHLVKFNSESSDLWIIFVSKVFNGRDLRRNKFLLKQLFDSTFHDSTLSPYYQTSFIQFLASGCSYNFKYPEINQEVLSKLEENLSHPYQNVRIAIAHLLSILFPDKVGVQQTGPQKNSRLVFVQHVVSKFEKAMLPLFSNDETSSNMAVIKSEIFNQDSVEGKQLLNFIETISSWITYSLDSNKLINPGDFIPLFPYLCSVQLAQSSNSQVQHKVKRAIELMGKISYSEAEIDVVFQMVEKVASNWNWRCRNQVPIFLQHFLYSNIFALSRNDRSVDRLVGVLNRLLEDEVVEVRESASITLSSLLIWNVVQGSRLTQLVEQFKSKSAGVAANGGEVLGKHSAVLGLCAFLYACPDDLPAHLPDILLFLTTHMSAPQPIPKSITKAFNSFKRFHLPNWVVYKRQFTSDQLNELNNIFISPSYYA